MRSCLRSAHPVMTSTVNLITQTTMSYTKRSPQFDRMMEEAREWDDLSHERYAEELYMNHRKGKLPEQPKEATRKPAERHNTKTAERH